MPQGKKTETDRFHSAINDCGWKHVVLQFFLRCVNAMRCLWLVLLVPTIPILTYRESSKSSFWHLQPLLTWLDDILPLTALRTYLGPLLKTFHCTYRYFTLCSFWNIPHNSLSATGSCLSSLSLCMVVVPSFPSSSYHGPVLGNPLS